MDNQHDFYPYDELPDAEPARPGLLMLIITGLVLLSMLGTLAWPLLRPHNRVQPTATPTPVFLRAA